MQTFEHDRDATPTSPSFVADTDGDAGIHDEIGGFLSVFVERTGGCGDGRLLAAPARAGGRPDAGGAGSRAPMTR